MVHLSMDGDFLGVIADGMMLPAAVAIWGDYAAVAELGGQITVLDKEGRRAAVLGTNTRPDEKANRTVEPSKWRSGIVTAPHGIAVNQHGDIFVSELNTFGRVHRFNRQ
jgi:polyribonucleotide nucleotidyltransferase